MNKNSKVLALKYRPQIFEDLIRQEIVSKTIFNSIKFNKIPNAYLFTGIRGIGITLWRFSRPRCFWSWQTERKIKYFKFFARIENFTGIIKVGQSGGITMKSPRVEKQQG